MISRGLQSLKANVSFQKKEQRWISGKCLKKRAISCITILCFSIQFHAHCLVPQWLSLWAMVAMKNRWICQILLFPGIAGGAPCCIWCLLRPQALVSRRPQRNSWKHPRKGKKRYWWWLGGQKVFRTLLRDLCAHWALQGELFYKQVTLVNTDWVWPSCKQLCSIEQWDHGPSHEGSLTPEVAYPNTVSLGCLGKHFQSVTVKLLKGFIWEEIFLSEQGGH